jgi:hypothetical protein
MKTRYAKPFESVQVKIPYETGMNPHSGLVDLFEAKEILKKDGNRLAYTTSDGEIVKLYRKEWERNENQCLTIVMAEISKDHENPKKEITTEVISETESA